jgi:phosphate transport system substrate-binding protein
MYRSTKFVVGVSSRIIYACQCQMDKEVIVSRMNILASERRIFLMIFGALLVSTMLILPACGEDVSESTESQSTTITTSSATANDASAPAPAAAPVAELTGTIEIDGSSTVYPISEAVAEEFNKVHSKVRVNVGVSGTGGGFKRFTVGETDISNASRPIKNPKETSQAEENGVQYVELRLGTDGLSVLVNLDNDFVDCLTVEELNAIWKPGSTIDNWRQVRAEFPDQKMRLYGPDSDSGTFDYFTEEINGEAQASRADYTASADDNVLVQGIAGDKGSLGYFGYAYYQENKDKLKLVAVDSGSGCVEPSLQTIPSGEYSPLSRPLFIYVNIDSLSRPEVEAFADFYMDNGPALTNEVGYVASDPSVYAENRDKLGR